MRRTVDIVRSCGHTESFQDDLPLVTWDRVKARLALAPCTECARRGGIKPANEMRTKEKEE